MSAEPERAARARLFDLGRVRARGASTRQPAWFIISTNVHFKHCLSLEHDAPHFELATLLPSGLLTPGCREQSENVFGQTRVSALVHWCARVSALELGLDVTGVTRRSVTRKGLPRNVRLMSPSHELEGGGQRAAGL